MKHQQRKTFFFGKWYNAKLSTTIFGLHVLAIYPQYIHAVPVMLLPPIGKRKPILLWQQIKNTERRESGQRLNISDSSSYMCHSSQESLT